MNTNKKKTDMNEWKKNMNKITPQRINPNIPPVFLNANGNARIPAPIAVVCWKIKKEININKNIWDNNFQTNQKSYYYSYHQEINLNIPLTSKIHFQNNFEQNKHKINNKNKNNCPKKIRIQ